MTLDGAIKHAEEVAKQNEEDAVIYSNCKNHKKNLYEIGLAENAEKKCCKCAEEHRQLAEWLKELRRLREQTRWIPCSERLPEVGRSVLLSVGSMYTAEGCLRDDGDWAQFRWDATLRKDMVDAWMPLPEAYKGDKNG